MKSNCKVFRTLKLGADIGNSFCNLVGENSYYDSFDSCLVENKGDDIEDAKNTIALKERHFTVGQGDITAQSIRRRDLDKYEALLAYGICRYLEALKIDTSETKVDLHLGIGLPTEDYAGFKEIYKERFNSSTLEVNYTGNMYTFSITELRIVPQASIVAHTNTKLFDGVPKGYIIDWGSFTVDVQEVNKGVLSKEVKKSYEVGTLTMLSGLAAVLKKYGVSLTTFKDIETFLINGRIRIEDEEKEYVTVKDTDVAEFINKEIQKVVERIKFDFKEIRTSEKTYIMGGGAILFRDALMDNKMFNDIVIDAAPEKVNAEAYYIFVGGR